MNNLKIGDLVTRPKEGAWGDNFKCHEFSFGKVAGFQMETKETRPDAARKFGVDEWQEVMIQPHDPEMAPIKERPWIHWGPEECMKLSKTEYILRVIVWPFIKLFYNRPLDGRNTDRR